MRRTVSHNSALASVAEARSDAAMAGISVYARTRPDVKSRLRVLARTHSIPHMMFLTNAGLASEESDAINSALLNFTADGKGREFFKDGAFGDMVPATRQDISRLETMLPLLEQRLDK